MVKFTFDSRKLCDKTCNHCGRRSDQFSIRSCLSAQMLINSEHIAFSNILAFDLIGIYVWIQLIQLTM